MNRLEQVQFWTRRKESLEHDLPTYIRRRDDVAATHPEAVSDWDDLVDKTSRAIDDCRMSIAAIMRDLTDQEAEQVPA